MAQKLTSQQKKAVDAEVKKQLKKSKNKLERNIETKLHKRLLQKSKSLTASTARRGARTTIYMGSQFKNHASTAVIAAFSFLIALVWKDFIVKLVQNNTRISLLEKYPYLAEFYIAIIITIIAIIGIAFVSKWARKEEKNKNTK